MKAERTVIGTHRSSSVTSSKIVLVVDREAEGWMRDKKNKKKEMNKTA